MRMNDAALHTLVHEISAEVMAAAPKACIEDRARLVACVDNAVKRAAQAQEPAPPPRRSRLLDTIVVTIDDGPLADRAGEAAADLTADAYDAHVIFVHVIPATLLAAIEGASSPPQIAARRRHRLQAENLLRGAGSRFLDRIAACGGAHPVDLEYVLREGPPAETILDVARERRATLIVIGTHADRVLTHLLLGSVGQHVLREATCPVLAIRTASEASATDVGHVEQSSAR